MEKVKEIFEYIRKRRHGKVMKVGVILGRYNDGVVKVGWSKCNIKKDRFILNEGLDLARKRITLLPSTQIPVTPLCIRRQFRKFGGRCLRYFKDAKALEFIAHTGCLKNE